MYCPQSKRSMDMDPFRFLLRMHIAIGIRWPTRGLERYWDDYYQFLSYISTPSIVITTIKLTFFLIKKVNEQVVISSFGADACGC